MMIRTGLGLRSKIGRSKLFYNLKNICFLPRVVFRRKIFCISIQRSGTTSVGDFLKDHGYRVAREHDGVLNNWGYLSYIGDYEKIFQSINFNAFQAFEDSPWWHPDFYKILYHRFPRAKFILFYRDSDQWFNSMLSLKGGKILGNTRAHCKHYRRLSEFYEKVDNDPDFNPALKGKDQLMSLQGMRDHYIRVYEEYNREAEEFYNLVSPESLFVSDLDNPNKWQELGEFLGIKVDADYDVHSHKTERLTPLNKR